MNIISISIVFFGTLNLTPLHRIKSQIDTASSQFIKNRNAYLELLQQYHSHLYTVRHGASPKALLKHHERGKLLVRERIDLLIDTNTPFLELSPLAALNMYDNQFPSAGIVTGIGVIHGRETMIIANDATIKGGTYNEQTIRKHVRAQEIAMENHLPCVYMVDSGGVYLPEQSRVFPDRFHFGRFFYNQARMSAQGIPQISLVMGSCTAGGAYVPAMSDETIIVRNQGTIFIGGPPLVKAATGQTVTAEALGGATIHTDKSGVADHLAENDRHAIQICRHIFETLPQNQNSLPHNTEFEDPCYSSDELYGMIPLDYKKAVDAREIIARIVDGSRFHEFKARYAPTLVTGFAQIMGFNVGIVANNGILFSETARKGAHFIELCNIRKTPLIFLQNITGFIVGQTYEHEGIARDGAKMVHAVANATVPKFTVITGGSFGAGNYAMAGRAYDPRLLFMWPNAKISVMGGEQAAQVLTTVKRDTWEHKNIPENKDELEQLTQNTRNKYHEEGSALYSTARLWDDGIIDPADTRKYLAMGLATAANAPISETKYGVFRM